MPTLHPLHPAARSSGRTPHRRGVTRLALAGGLVAVGLGGVACGSSSDATAPTILNTEKVERAIEHSGVTQRNTATQVTCPSGVHQKKGLTFRCTAVAAHGTTTFTVNELDNDGHVHYEAR